MLKKGELRVVLYASVLITIMLNIPRILSLNPQGFMATIWVYNPLEITFQFAFNFVFCLYMGFLAYKVKNTQVPRQRLMLMALFLVLVPISGVIGAQVQELLAKQETPYKIISGVTHARMFISALILAGIVRMYALSEKLKQRELENERLSNRSLRSELQLLQNQMNPHFLFNSLSTLTTVVREDPDLAQKYIGHLSKVFRYNLNRSDLELVSLQEELEVLRSHAELTKMRLECAFDMQVDIPKEFMRMRMPPMTLQPLLENALKHNMATEKNPLKVQVTVVDQELVFTNNLQPTKFPGEGHGVGLGNLNERYKLLYKQEISIEQTDTEFIVKLPLNS